MYSPSEQKQLKILLFLLAGSKFLAAIILFYFYLGSKNIYYLPVSFLLALAGFGIIYLYMKKVINR